MKREALYRALSEGGNAEFATIMKVVAALGLHLTVAPTTQTAAAVPAPEPTSRALARTCGGPRMMSSGAGCMLHAKPARIDPLDLVRQALRAARRYRLIAPRNRLTSCSDTGAARFPHAPRT